MNSIKRKNDRLAHTIAALCALAMIVFSLVLLHRITGQSYDTVPYDEKTIGQAPAITTWFEKHPSLTEGVPPITVAQEPFVTLQYDNEHGLFIRLQNGTHEEIIRGAFMNAYLCDLNGDGFPELCTTQSVGSGIVDHRIFVHDIIAQKSYSLAHRFYHDYVFEMRDGALLVTKTTYPFYGKNVQTVCEGFPVLVETSHGIQLKIAVTE